MEIISEATLVITKASKIFNWDGFGSSIHIRGSSLPDGVLSESCHWILSETAWTLIITDLIQPKLKDLLRELHPHLPEDIDIELEIDDRDGELKEIKTNRQCWYQGLFTWNA